MDATFHFWNDQGICPPPIRTLVLDRPVHKKNIGRLHDVVKDHTSYLFNNVFIF